MEGELTWSQILESKQIKAVLTISRILLLPLLISAVGSLWLLITSVGDNRDFSEQRAKDNESFQAAMFEFKKDSVAADQAQAADIASIKTDLAVSKAILEEMRRQNVAARSLSTLPAELRTPR